MVNKRKMLIKSPHPKFLNSVVKPHCAPTQPCPKCSLLMVIRYRFNAFSEQFGREPKPTEPLFFDPTKNRPVKASLSDARDQIEAAATAVGIKAAPVLRFLKLDSIPEEHGIARTLGQPVIDGASSGLPAKRIMATRQQPKPGSVFERFSRDTRLHRLHNITRKELRTLSGLAMMGQMKSSADALYILGLIREQTELQ